MPDQHEGTLVDGRWFYLRLRWGVAVLGLGDTLDAAVEDSTGGQSVFVGDSLMGKFESDGQRDQVFSSLLERAVRATVDQPKEGDRG